MNSGITPQNREEIEAFKAAYITNPEEASKQVEKTAAGVRYDLLDKTNKAVAEALARD
jgi:hypothetical protein